MGKKLVDKLLPALNRMSWPTEPVLTSVGYKAYEVCIQRVDQYEDDPRVLLSGIKAVQTADSRPYAFAGVAYALIGASAEPDGSYYQRGLSIALEWLEKTQAIEPDLVEVNVWEALIYIYSQRLDDARLVLDYLSEIDPNNFLLARVEIDYWQRRNDIPKTEASFAKAIQHAPNGIMRVYVQRRLARFYSSVDMHQKAIEEFRRVLHFYPDDGRLWHELSLVYLQADDLDEAENANKQALAHNGPAAAADVAKRIQEKKKESRKGWRSLLG